LTPFVVGPEGEDEDEEGEDGEKELHGKQGTREQGDEVTAISGYSGKRLTMPFYAVCFWGEDSLRRVRRASPASQRMRRMTRAVSMRPVRKRTMARMGWCSRR